MCFKICLITSIISLYLIMTKEISWPKRADTGNSLSLSLPTRNGCMRQPHSSSILPREMPPAAATATAAACFRTREGACEAGRQAGENRVGGLLTGFLFPRENDSLNSSCVKASLPRSPFFVASQKRGGQQPGRPRQTTAAATTKRRLHPSHQVQFNEYISELGRRCRCRELISTPH